MADIRPTTALRAMLDAEAYWPAEILEAPHVTLCTTTGPLLFLTGAEHVRAAVKADSARLPRSRLQQRFAGHGTGRENVVTDIGERSLAHRRTLAPLFRAQRLPGFFPFIGATVRQALAPWYEAAKSGTAIDVTRACVHATFGVVWQIMFGQEGRLVPGEEVSEMADILFTASVTGRLSATSAAVHEVTRRSMTLRPDRPLVADTPFASVQPADFALTEQELHDNIRFLMTAGHESTALTITWALLLLALNPDLQDEVAREVEVAAGEEAIDHAALHRMSLLDRVLNETMRLYPAAILVNREAMTDLVLHDVAVSAGTQVAICFYGMHRHRAHWDRPDLFDPYRFAVDRPAPSAFLPFSAGHHSCLGGHLAWVEAMSVLSTAVRELSFTAVDRDIRPAARYTLRPDRPVSLRISRRRR
jgi:cytochrome P450